MHLGLDLGTINNESLGNSVIGDFFDGFMHYCFVFLRRKKCLNQCLNQKER